MLIPLQHREQSKQPIFILISSGCNPLHSEIESIQDWHKWQQEKKEYIFLDRLAAVQAFLSWCSVANTIFTTLWLLVNIDDCLYFMARGCWGLFFQVKNKLKKSTINGKENTEDNMRDMESYRSVLGPNSLSVGTFLQSLFQRSPVCWLMQLRASSTV